MFENLKVLSLATQLSQHAAKSQALASKNLANIDSPGYQAETMSEFKADDFASGVNVRMSKTRAIHFDHSFAPSPHQIGADISNEQKPNGNSVSLEAETFKSIEAERLHSRAISVYQSSLNILRSSIGRGR